MALPPPLDEIAYWVIPGRVLAGRHPCRHRDDPEPVLDALSAAGVTLCVDLTRPEDGAADYSVQWRERDRAYLGEPTIDFSAPTEAATDRVLAAVHATVARGEAAYVHCWGGIGRSGTIAGCLLRESGCPRDGVLRALQDLRAPLLGEDADLEDDDQVRRVLGWEPSGARTWPPAS